MPTTKLSTLANARSGDKGATANIAVIPHTPQSYEFLKVHLTPQRVENFFSPMRPPNSPPVLRYDLPNLQSFNFLLPNILPPSGSLNLRIDAQGKALAQILLELTLETPDNLLP